MSVAWAAEGAAHGHEPFYATAEFWVAVAFVIFIALIAKRVANVVTVALDNRAERIRNQIEEAERLVADARRTLAGYERKQKEAAADATAIIENATREAERFARQAAQDLEAALVRREQAAKERIAQAEAEAIADVRRRAADAAIEAARRLLAEKLPAARSRALVDDAIKALPKILH